MGEEGSSDSLYTSAGAYTSVHRKGPARVEGAPADSRMVDKASGTGLYTAGLPVSEFHQRECRELHSWTAAKCDGRESGGVRL
jgi:hypothetical protein